MGWFTKEWDYDKVPDLTGKVAIVTGGSAGLGKHTCLELARKNATVFVMGRTESKTKETVQQIIKETGNEKVFYILIDLMDLDSVTKASNEFIAKELPLHILINNAGIIGTNNIEFSKNEIESQFATNHFSHVHFTLKLLPILKKSAPSRIVIVSSEAHGWVKSKGIVYDKLNDKKAYSQWGRYAETKLANVYFTRYLSKALKELNIENVYVNAVHPGGVKTEITRNEGAFLIMLVGLVFLTVERGAKTQVFVATDSSIETNQVHGKYFVPFCKQIDPKKLALDQSKTEECWNWTVKILKEKLKDEFNPQI